MQDLEWTEIRCSGEHFTWDRNLVKEKIDWIFANQAWVDQYQTATGFHLTKFGSDHRPLLLQFSPMRWPPRPRSCFQCKAAWLLEEDFSSIVRQGWSTLDWNTNVEQFTHLARTWDQETVGNLPKKKAALRNRIEGVERARSKRDSQHLAQTEKELWGLYNRTLAQEELMWFQRSRCNWLKWGDQNTKFFHTSAVIRRKKNTIDGLKDEGGDWIFDQAAIRNMTRAFYTDLFRKDTHCTDILSTATSFHRLSNLELAAFSAMVSPEEVKRATFDLGALKAPGPDGIQAFVYHKFWDAIGESLCALVHNIWENPSAIQSLNNTNIVLIPKVDIPQTLKEFHPISLCNVSYKVISKIISNRLRPLMGKLVGNHQCSFIAGRQSSDNIIIAQEVIHSMRTRGKRPGWMAVKVDLEKAYDRLDWDFVQATLTEIGIEGKILEIIMACITTTSFRILWNGEPTEQF